MGRRGLRGKGRGGEREGEGGRGKEGEKRKGEERGGKGEGGVKEEKGGNMVQLKTAVLCSISCAGKFYSLLLFASDHCKYVH